MAGDLRLPASAEVHGIARPQEGDAVDEGRGAARNLYLMVLGVDVERVEAEAPIPVEDRDRGLGGKISRTGRAEWSSAVRRASEDR